MSNRSIRAKIARETLQILECGFYFNSKNGKVSIKEDLDYVIKKSIHYKPSIFDKVGLERAGIIKNWDQEFKTIFDVNFKE